MSSVRMCDKCGQMFSELESGWQTYEATTIEDLQTGERKRVTRAMDACASCAMVPITRTQRMEAALGIGPSPVAVRPDPGPTYDTDVIR